MDPEKKIPPIPEEVLRDDAARPIVCCWNSDKRVTMSVQIPDDWEDPGLWGILLAGLMDRVIDAYSKRLPDRTVGAIKRRIVGVFTDETDKPPDKPSARYLFNQN